MCTQPFGESQVSSLYAWLCTGFCKKKIDHIAQVHFGIEDCLVINAQLGSQLLRYIPHGRLKGDFPDSLLLGYAHWLNVDNSQVEFRPLEQAWQPCASNWLLSFNHAVAVPATMKRHRCTMVDVRSQLYQELANILTSLDRPEYMVVYLTSDDTIVTEMVRLRLRFFVNEEGALESPELNATVDRDQDIGCFYGLKNKLVLRDSKQKYHRSVLIPYGDAQLFKETHHTIVRIEPPEEPHIRYFRYSLDPHLNVLRGPVEMLGVLYQAYMHALTGFVLPDPATKRCGTAEALRILRQARLRSSLPLQEGCITLLGHLAALSPRRVYYPSHMRCMQSIEWNSDLGVLAQHDDFKVVVQEIIDYPRSFSMLHAVSGEAKDAGVKCYQNRGEQHLLERARLRHAQFYYAEFGSGTIYPVPRPSLYPARDRGSTSPKSRRVYEVATLIRDWTTNVPQFSDLYTTVASWKCVRISDLPVRRFTCNELLELSFGDAWGALYELCRSSDRHQDSYSLMSLFCTIAFKGDEQLTYLRPLLAIAFSGRFADLPLPGFGEEGRPLHVQCGQDLVSSEINDMIDANYAPFRSPPHISALSKARKKEIKEEIESYNTEKESCINQCRNAVVDQWPIERPELPDVPQLNRERASDACALLCTQWYQNRIFLSFLRQVQERLNAIVTDPTAGYNWSVPPALPRQTHPAKSSFQPPSLLDLLRSCEPTPAPRLKPPLKFCRPRVPQCYSSDTDSELRAFISRLCNEPDPCRREFGEGLQESLEALETSEVPCSPASLPVAQEVLERYCRDLEQQRDGLWATIHRTLTATHGAHETVASGVLWPKISVVSILSLLFTDRWQLVPDIWKSTLLTYAQSIASLRRCERLLAFCYHKDIDGFYKEAEALECEAWDAAKYPEWLLLEIENNITIRSLQAKVAQRMVKPDPPENSVLQLNMGEGKTTVIIPMTALALANGSLVPRIIVLKPLLRQSLNLLTQLLGEILNRPVYYIPFSRDTPLNKTTVKALQKIYRECQKRRGVLISLPEHILSFRLLGLDLVRKNPSLARKAIKLEMWLQDNCRNIIDESDEILDPKFQLVYTVGNQQSLDGEHDRWRVTQSLLALVEQQAKKLHSQDSTYLDIEYHAARYPIFHFLRTDTADTLIHMVLKAIYEHGLPGLPLHLWSQRIRQRAFNFIRFTRTTAQEDRTLRDAFEHGAYLRRLLVLRGLLVHRILKFALARPNRCLMAVPYRAKGIPSEHAEFGHPDVAITLTCLSYYYHGLSREQVRHCFTLVGKENEPAAEYQHWIQRELSTLPDELRALAGANLEDTRTFHEILYPHLQYQKGLIDFYLSRVVFPKEAKEFPHKLCSSAWDIPSRSNQPLTTGFSGTNDNRLLLPCSAPQRDLPDLLHTNAMVLNLLLQKENRQCILAQDSQGHPLRAEQLIDLIGRQDPPVRVIVDVGAQILELSNLSVAQRWLSITQSVDVEAAIFFDEHDEAVVVDRDGHVERLLSSAFQQRMGKCLLFLDQQHSRGVDLKLPLYYRAAVTLGPRLAKDRLVQGRCVLWDMC
jgi:hypothetical protein